MQGNAKSRFGRAKPTDLCGGAILSVVISVPTVSSIRMFLRYVSALYILPAARSACSPPFTSAVNSTIVISGSASWPRLNRSSINFKGKKRRFGNSG
jgi:hypothetical protein